MAAAAFMNRFGGRLVESGTPVPQQQQSRDERFRSRQLPNESVFFYLKTIDNSRVARQHDPKNHGKAWRGMLTTIGGALMLILVLLPSAYTFIAGHELQALHHQREHLLVERRQLEVQEAQLLTPARLEYYAESQKMADPGNKMVYLAGDKGGSLAMVHSGGRH
jgi:hypothetical protein